MSNSSLGGDASGNPEQPTAQSNKYNRTMDAPVPSNIKVTEFRQRMLKWFDHTARDLPWRKNREPYSVWVSEIMLQQTRVAAVVEHYTRFMGLFPSVEDLARAAEPEVLAAWSGLGYYRRARYLHRAAQLVASQHAGRLPKSPSELRKLPGIGEYTAAAISSIAYGLPIAAVDGNVQRVVQRMSPPQPTSPPSYVGDYAQSLLDPRRPGDFNQAMMELGATVCMPKKPVCGLCPVQGFCATRGEHVVLPRKPMRSRQIAYMLVVRDRKSVCQVLLQQRPAESTQMPGMWELPEATVCEADLDKVDLTLRHAITTTNYHVTILRFSEKEGAQRLQFPEYAKKWIAAGELNQTALTGLARKVLRRLGIIPSVLPVPRSADIRL